MSGRGVKALLALSVVIVWPLQAQDGQLVDRIVAVVDEDPILASDLDRVIGLGLIEPGGEETEEGFRRRVLDRVIEERLRFHEIDRFGFTEVSLNDVDRGVEEIRGRFRSDEVFEDSLRALGVEKEELRQLVARQLMVMTYVDERLGPRVFVSADEIRQYYDETLVPELEGRGEPVADLASVREEIRAVLKELRLDDEIVRWTAELRAEADIEDYLESGHTAVPPVALAVDEDSY